MKIWTNAIPYTFNELASSVFTEDILFFDIETTGFSPSYTSLYLIGCAYRKNDLITITQFFADTESEEANVLSEFLQLLSSFSKIATFNGLGFDLPYLDFKCKKYQFFSPFSQKESVDFYKIATSMRHFFQLPDYKQKTLESFLNIRRNDCYTGGELIAVYKKYISSPDGTELNLLKQHNYEDILGLIQLLPLLNYKSLFSGNFTVSDLETNLYKDINGDYQKELIFTLFHPAPLPAHVSYRLKEFYFTGTGSYSRLSVRLYDGELKFFLEHPKEYYYLPEEDRAIHKSVATYVDKAYRKKASKTNCYTRKNSIFVPQYEDLFSPVFKENYKDRHSYFELTETFLSSDDQIFRYVLHILQQMVM